MGDGGATVNRLPRPVKAALGERTWDAEVTRGWARLQIKRRVRAPRVVPVLVAASAFLLAAVVWAATRQDGPQAPVEALMVSAPPAHAVSCMPEPVRPDLPPTSVAPVSFVAPSPAPQQPVHARAAISTARRQLPPAPACTTVPPSPMWWAS
jgi:hypothetical protein